MEKSKKWLFGLFLKYWLPQSTPNLTVIPPVKKIFGFGISGEYKSELESPFPENLSTEELISAVEDINDRLTASWPCSISQVFGLLFLFVTLGLSLIVPYYSFKNCQDETKAYLSKLNKYNFNKKGVSLKLVSSFPISWLELSKVT